MSWRCVPPRPGAWRLRLTALPAPSTRVAALSSILAVALWSGVAGQLSARPSPAEADPAAHGPSEGLTAEAARQILVTIEQGPSRRSPRVGSTPKGYSGRSYRASPRSKRVAAKLARDYGLEQVDAWPIEPLEVHCVVYEVPDGKTATEMVSLLEQDPRVEMVQPMSVFKTLSQEPSGGYDDPYFELQHGVRAMQVEEAHGWARGVGVRVAVVDTGVDIHHPEFEGRVIAAENFVENRSRSFAGDVHGTAVAGVIASAAGNGIGIVGVAPQVKLMALKACWPERRGAAGAVCTSFSLAQAVTFAIRKDADVLNLSLAGPPDLLLGRLLRKAAERGLVVVAAADADPAFSFPAVLDEVIGVRAAGAPVEGDALSEVRLAASVAAPGVDVLTIFPDGAFDFLSGSSLAAAHVAGVVALMLERQPRLEASHIASLLRDASGNSRLVNACAALLELVPNAACPAASPSSGGHATAAAVSH